MTDKRKIQGLAEQGIDEAIVYLLDTANYPAGPVNAAAVTVKVYTDPDRVDVTATVTSGAIAVALGVIQLPKIAALVADTNYRLEVKWTATDGNIYECWGIIPAEL